MLDKHSAAGMLDKKDTGCVGKGTTDDADCVDVDVGCVVDSYSYNTDIIDFLKLSKEVPNLTKMFLHAIICILSPHLIFNTVRVNVGRGLGSKCLPSFDTFDSTDYGGSSGGQSRKMVASKLLCTLRPLWEEYVGENGLKSILVKTNFLST